MVFSTKQKCIHDVVTENIKLKKFCFATEMDITIIFLLDTTVIGSLNFQVFWIIYEQLNKLEVKEGVQQAYI